MPQTLRLTTAQALVRKLACYRVEVDGAAVPYFAGVWAIFGHGNVAALGEALYAQRHLLPTFRAHNEQAMALAAIAFAKANFRRRAMVAASSIGPGATNMVTAAAVAHVNRLPLLLLPADVFAARPADPVLQQVEDFHDGGISANDCFKPVSRYFDRIVHPEQLLSALPRAVAVLTDPALCGPATLALPQDVQAMAYDYPTEFFAPEQICFRAPSADPSELARVASYVAAARRPLIIAGGGVLYAGAGEALRQFAELHDVPVAETQAGKSSLPWDHPLQLGAIGVSGSPAANELAREADLVIAAGTRLGDFATGSHALFPAARVVSINVNPLDAMRFHATALVADCGRGMDVLSAALGDYRAEPAWRDRAVRLAEAWRARVAEITAASARRPYEAQVIGAVQASSEDSPSGDIVVAAAGSLPAELHRLWRAAVPGAYHLEYGYSCMGYEIAGAIGVKLARPEREVVVFVGDGSYLMMNSELATSVALGLKLIVVVLDNRGFACIHRLQLACGGEPFNNLLDGPAIDFAAHARSLGCDAEHVADIAALGEALRRARAGTRTQVIVIDTDPSQASADGGAWWELGIPEVSGATGVQAARRAYAAAKAKQRA
jgi:3D-(3,5/4)-trihydroxycyclohexane-1,2-dione acylhydrolase (decyclizing)